MPTRTEENADKGYSQLPHNFERYSEADQARIASRMVAVVETHQQGTDLETDPFTADKMTLSAAKGKLKLQQVMKH